jgi:hypothetical protein
VNNLPNLAPDSLYDGDIPSKIETNMCLIDHTLPATLRPSKSDFLPLLTAQTTGGAGIVVGMEVAVIQKRKNDIRRLESLSSISILEGK